MSAIILSILTRVIGGAATGFITSNLAAIGIALAVGFAGTLIGGGIGWIKGHNAAAAKCQTQSLRREIKELQRDRDAQKQTAEFLSTRVKELEGRAAAGDQKVADYEAELAKRTNDPCVLTPADLGRVRGKRAR